MQKSRSDVGPVASKQADKIVEAVCVASLGDGVFIAVEHFLCNTFVDPTLLEKRCQLSMNQWSFTWRGVSWAEGGDDVCCVVHCH